MSISLPKLELPQISIKASVKNKKPFVLKLPVIKFNGYANTEEDNSYDSGHSQSGYNGQSNHGSGASYNGQSSYGSSSSGASGYASAGSGASGYASATPDAYSSAGQPASSSGYSDHPSSSSGYSEQPQSSPSYPADAGNQYTSNEPAYTSSGYSADTQGASVYTGKAQQSLPQAPQYTSNEEQPAQPEYHTQNVYQVPSHAYNNRPAVNPYSNNLPSEQDNSYYVASVNNHRYQEPQQYASRKYREEAAVSDPVSLYQAASNVYQGSVPYVVSSETLPQQMYTWAV